MAGILDHVGFNVADFDKSRAFYVAALAPLGITMLFGDEKWAMFGRDGAGAFHAAALAAGGKDNGGPGLRDYHPNYYGAFIIDPDGHNIEAVCHMPE